MTRGAAVLPVSGVLLDVQELRAGAQAGGHVLHKAEHLGIAEVLLAEEEDEGTGALLLARVGVVAVAAIVLFGRAHVDLLLAGLGPLLGMLLAIPLSAFCVVLWRAIKTKYLKG